MVNSLILLERGYSNPPRQADLANVKALRGAIIVMAVGAFEAYLRDLMDDLSSMLADHFRDHRRYDLDRLPDDIKVGFYFLTLELALKGPRYTQSRKIDRLDDIRKACANLVAGQFDGEAYKNTAGNPNSEVIKGLFTQFGDRNFFNGVRPEFDRRWGKEEAQAYLTLKVNEILEYRHKIAHTADVSGITRQYAKESAKFIKILVEATDVYSRRNLASIIQACQIP
nr:HEPN domain-containing protein [Deinococcus sp. 23YEL01]